MPRRRDGENCLSEEQFAARSFDVGASSTDSAAFCSNDAASNSAVAAFFSNVGASRSGAAAFFSNFGAFCFDGGASNSDDDAASSAYDSPRFAVESRRIGVEAFYFIVGSVLGWIGRMSYPLEDIRRKAPYAGCDDDADAFVQLGSIGFLARRGWLVR